MVRTELGSLEPFLEEAVVENVSSVEFGILSTQNNIIILKAHQLAQTLFSVVVCTICESPPNRSLSNASSGPELPSHRNDSKVPVSKRYGEGNFISW